MHRDPWPLVVPARLVNGAIVLNRARLHAQLRQRRDCELEIVLERKQATRSLVANAYYWFILGLIHEDTGQPVQDLHEYFKLKLNVRPLVLTDRHGVIVAEERIGASTSTLNKVQFYDYVEAVRAFARDELGIVTPDPDPNWKQQRDGVEVVG